MLFQEDGSAEIKRVYIRPEYRGRKLGEQTVSEIETILVPVAVCHRDSPATGYSTLP
ncbi:hypothetical protein [Pseudomonas cerasi]